MLRLIFLLFFYQCFIISGQDIKNYLDKYSTNLKSDETPLKSIETSFLNYNFYFFSEQHKTSGADENEVLLFQYLSKRKKIKKIFVEFPLSLQFDLNELHWTSPKDTFKYNFKFVSMFDKGFETLIRNVYIHNLDKRNQDKTEIVAIDKIETNQLLTSSIRRYFKKPLPDKISRGLKFLKKIKNTPFISQSKRIKLYGKFYSELKQNNVLYHDYLGEENFKQVSRILNGIEIAHYERTSIDYDHNIREDFLFRNITDLIDTTITSDYVSINGHLHTPLTLTKELVGVKDWKSLASRMNSYSNKIKVCSVYFMNRSDDIVSDMYFQTEKEILGKNIPLGEVRLIQINGENSPFRNMSDKYQYILFW